MPAPSLPVYLDCAATTPVDPAVVDAMLPWLQQGFGNPASRSHAWGWQAADAVEQARQHVAALIGADPREIVWTSGATESDNLAITGAALQHAERGRHLITLATEHAAVLDTLAALQQQGFEVTVLGVQPDGLVDLQRLRAAMRPDTVLVSTMLVNNEIGVVQDVAAIGTLCREQGVLLHVDAAQATGKLPIDLRQLPVDLMSLTAHKTHGPKGIGALYVRREPAVRITGLMHGGGHERGLRSGTLATHQIVGMGEAYRMAASRLQADIEHAAGLQQRLLQGLAPLPGLRLNGHASQRVPHIINLSFAGVDGDLLQSGLDSLAVSSGSACNSAQARPSHVLRALGHSDELAHASLRISTGRFSTEADIDHAVSALLALLQERSAAA